MNICIIGLTYSLQQLSQMLFQFCFLSVMHCISQSLHFFLLLKMMKELVKGEEHESVEVTHTIAVRNQVKLMINNSRKVKKLIA